MKNCLLWLWLATSLALIPAPCRAQVFVKPSGFKAMPVRVQTLRADVEIVGALAVTNWTMTAQLESAGFSDNYQGTVCDFICARPVDAKVTAFSANTLNGRVVERGVAAPLVGFRGAPNDPLKQSGLNASNSFRATIYPLSPWGEVTLRGTWVQTLASSPRGATYRLPLLALKGATMRLPELNVQISVRDGAWQGVSNSYELPTQTQNGAKVFTLGQKNYRVLRDLTVNLAPQKTPSSAPMLASQDGHFALAFVASKTLQNLRVSGTGIDSSSASKSVRAGEVATVTGTYKGNTKDLGANLSAEGLASVPLVPVSNEAARGLWATQKINALSGMKGSRAQIIGLSRRYSVASAFTSWLTVGDEDLKIYRRALVSAQLDPLVREYWIRVARGQEKGARGIRLRKAVARISSGNGLNLEEELYARLGSTYKFVVWQKYDDYSPQKKANNRGADKRIARLNQVLQKYLKPLGVKAQTYGESNVLYFGTRAELEDLRAKIKTEYRKLHPDYAQLKSWEHRIVQISGSTDFDPRLAFWRAQVKARELETQTASAEKVEDKTLLAKLQQERNQNSNIYFTNNVGDPPIYVQAPADARQVVAVMPDGQVKTLDYNHWQKRWEGNYDVPTGTRDGDYKIQIVIVLADNSRRTYAMPFRVDTKSPGGRGEVLVSPRDPSTLRLRVEGSGDVAFVSALLPWGEKVFLLPSTQEGNAFFALLRAPREFAGKPFKVTFLLIDRAHNTSSIEAQRVAKSP